MVKTSYFKIQKSSNEDLRAFEDPPRVKKVLFLGKIKRTSGDIFLRKPETQNCPDITIHHAGIRVQNPLDKWAILGDLAPQKRPKIKFYINVKSDFRPFLGWLWEAKSPKIAHWGFGRGF